MGLRSALARAAVSRPRVLLAAGPGSTRERLAVEAELARRGWPCANGPAEADLLVVLGDRQDEEPGWVTALWQGVAAPGARVRITGPEQAAEALDRGLADLRHGEHEARPPHDEHHDKHHDEHDEHDDEVRATAHGGHDMQGSDGVHDMHGGDGEHDMRAGHDTHGGHHGHAGHAGHDMGVVEGLPMAGRGDDRDGLRLDVLHVPLGPVLTDWPAGLILRLALQGDVVQRATVEPVTAPPSPRPPFWDEPWSRAAVGEHVTRGDAARRLCAAHLDSLGRFLAVAGWDDLAARARYVRDRALTGADAAELTALVRPLIRRAERSRTLRWLTAGLGALPAGHARHAGVTGPALAADGDAYSRLLVWLDAVGRSAAACGDTAALDATTGLTGPRGRLDAPVSPSRALLDCLPGLLEGTEFACARIVVASLDPDLDEPTRVPAAGAVHGHG